MPTPGYHTTTRYLVGTYQYYDNYQVPVCVQVPKFGFPASGPQARESKSIQGKHCFLSNLKT
eukprot:402767-Rhodomonas_salina.2